MKYDDFFAVERIDNPAIALRMLLCLIAEREKDEESAEDLV